MRRPMPRPDSQANDPSHITSHPFKPRREWYGACDVCGLAESAHKDTLLKRDEKGKVLNGQGPWDGE